MSVEGSEAATSLRIAMFTEAYPPIVSGVAISTKTLVEGLRGLGHQVDVFTPSHREQPVQEPGAQRLPSVSMPVPGWIPLSLPLTPLAFEKIARRRYDIVHTQHPFLLGTVARALARRQNVPLVATLHTQYEQYVHYWTPWHEPGRRIVRRITREFYNTCDTVITVAAGMERVLREYGVTTPIKVIPNDLNLSAYLQADGSGVREELGLEPQEVFLLNVGRLAVEKNLLFLLEAVAPLLDGEPPARLVFVGDGPLRAELESRVEQKQLRDRVRFVGALPHAATARYYAAADIFLMPSVTEVNPLVIGEALAAGTPVVAVDSFSAREAVTDGQDGLIAAHDTAAFCHTLRNLMARPEEIRRMSTQARENARQRTSCSAAKRTTQLYYRLIGQGYGASSARSMDSPAVKKRHY